jgi:hypothetical protein
MNVPGGQLDRLELLVLELTMALNAGALRSLRGALRRRSSNPNHQDD